MCCDLSKKPTVVGLHGLPFFCPMLVAADWLNSNVRRYHFNGPILSVFQTDDYFLNITRHW